MVQDDHVVLHERQRQPTHSVPSTRCAYTRSSIESVVGRSKVFRVAGCQSGSTFAGSYETPRAPAPTDPETRTPIVETLLEPLWFPRPGPEASALVVSVRPPLVAHLKTPWPFDFPPHPPDLDFRCFGGACGGEGDGLKLTYARISAAPWCFVTAVRGVNYAASRHFGTLSAPLLPFAPLRSGWIPAHVKV